jgi:hypothetical protein
VIDDLLPSDGAPPSSGVLLGPLPSALLGMAVVLVVVLMVVREVLRLHRPPEDRLVVVTARAVTGLLPAVLVLLALRLFLVML